MDDRGLARVVFVDDDPSTLALHADYFEHVPWLSVTVRSTADEALALADREGIDCLVSDSIRTAAGESLVEHVAREYPDIPTVLYSGKPADDLPVEVASGFVRKGPGSGTKSLEALETAIRRQTDRARSDPEPPETDGAGTWRILGHFEWDGSRSASVTLVQAIADALGKDAGELDPLFATVDPEALDALIDSGAASGARSPVEIQFDYLGHRIKVEASGLVAYRP